MALSTLDPKTALIVIDLQRGIASYPTIEPVDDIATRAGALAAAFRRHGLPVVLVTVVGAPSGRTDQKPRELGALPEGWTDLLPALDQQPDDYLVTKKARSAFTNTGLTERLRSLDVTQVVIVGVSTSSGVESTARDAHENGFNVTLAVDAMTDMSAESHQHSITRIFPRIAESGTTQEVLELLDQTRP
jgi:nicotinamidase-related amidase